MATAKLVLNRDFTMATNKGHVIEFKKGVPTHVPPSVYNDALSIGAVPADGSAPEVLVAPADAPPPADPADRSPLIKDAIAGILLSNEREDFTAAGTPTVDAVSKAVGFKVQSREIATCWQEMNDTKAAQ